MPSKDLIYGAARQCYYDGWIADQWEDICGHPYGTITDENKEKLIKHILDSGHHSVLEHVTFTFAIDGVSRSLTHQLVRHRTASYSQQSQRFVNFTKGKDTHEKLCTYIKPPKIEADPVCEDVFENVVSVIERAYKTLVARGIKPEDARYLLPNAASTRIVVTQNARALINFFGERCCTKAQWEIRSLAWQMLQICQDVLPIVFDSIGPKCFQLGKCPEKKGCGLYKKMNTIPFPEQCIISKEHFHPEYCAEQGRWDDMNGGKCDCGPKCKYHIDNEINKNPVDKRKNTWYIKLDMEKDDGT